MTDLLLAKPTLSPDEIDLSVGEATIVKHNLFKFFPSLCDPMILAMESGISMQELEYPPSNGLTPLVKLLEEKYGSPVLIGNGAKQLLGALFYALDKTNRFKICLQPIHWALLPPFAHTHRLSFQFMEPKEASHKLDMLSGYLLLAPNNPDNVMYDYQTLQQLSDAFNCEGVDLFHDAAYYSHSYLPEDYQLGPVGDIQIFSFSKLLGLSGVRGGFAVFHDTYLYRHMIEYLEMMTVGVSVLSQKFLYAVMKKMQDNPETTKLFERANFAQFKEAKKMIKEIPASIIEVPKDIEEQAGMFCWAKIMDEKAFVKAGIHIVNGEPFGDKEKVRLNLGVAPEVLRECVERLKKVA